MRTAAEWEHWRAPRLVAGMWFCGDYTCDCTQPQVEEIRPNIEVGYPWIRRAVLWQGTFLSQTDDCEPEERERQYIELKVAAMEYGISLDDHGCGDRPL